MERINKFKNSFIINFHQQGKIMKGLMQFSTKKNEKEIFPFRLFIPSRVKNSTYKGESEMQSSHFTIASWLLNKQP